MSLLCYLYSLVRGNEVEGEEEVEEHDDYYIREHNTCLTLSKGTATQSAAEIGNRFRMQARWRKVLGVLRARTKVLP